MEAQSPSEENVSPTPATEPATPETQSEAGYEFVVEPGDTVYAMVKALNEKGVTITVDDVLAANPSLEPTRLQTGQKLFVPANPVAKVEAVKEEN